MRARLKQFTVDVEIIETEAQRKEFEQYAQIGDVILTHPNGARLPMVRALFDKTYDVIEPEAMA